MFMFLAPSLISAAAAAPFCYIHNFLLLICSQYRPPSHYRQFVTLMTTNKRVDFIISLDDIHIKYLRTVSLMRTLHAPSFVSVYRAFLSSLLYSENKKIKAFIVKNRRVRLVMRL